MRKLTSSLLVLFSVSLAMALNPGDLVITEIMQNPAAVSDANGEWFEIYNATDAAIPLLNLTFTEDGGGNTFVIDEVVSVDPGSYALLANNGDPLTNGGLPTVDYVFPGGFYLGNSTDEIIIIDTDLVTIIDEVWWDNGVTFPDPSGASMTLMGDQYDNNNVGSSWYEEETYTYGDGDYGTPRNPNSLVGFPVISDVTQLPESPGSADDVVVSASVTDPAVRTLVSVDLIYSVDGGLESTLAMNADGDIYSETIPAQSGGAVVTWRIEATDDDDQLTTHGPIIYTVVDVPVYTIYDIQYTTVPGDDGLYPSLLDGTVVTLTGIVTAIGHSGSGSFFLQDSDSPWSGIQVYGDSLVALNDEVTVTGEVEEYYGQTEILLAGGGFVINSSGNAPYLPVLNDLGVALAEPYESMLVRVEDVTCSGLPDSYGVWQITDGVDTGDVDDWLTSYTPTLDQCYDIQGLNYYAYGSFKLNPRDLSEIAPCGGGNLPPVIADVYHLPLLPTSTDLVTVTATVTDDVGVDHVDLVYTVDGGGAITVPMTVVTRSDYTADIPAQVDGSLVEYYIEATDTPDMETSTSVTYAYSVVDVYTCVDIADVRANDANGVPLMDGQGVMICGVLSVGHEFGTSGPAYLTHATGSVAFHGGVFGDDTELVIGDEVEVIGIVGAYNGLTQIQNSVVINDLGFAGEPTPVTTTLADLNLAPESYEAQLLLIEGVTLVDPENWPVEGEFATVTVQQGAETFALYIDRDTNIDGSVAPAAPFDLVAIVSQYDSSLPWDEGYNLSPRNLDDIGMGTAPPVVTIYDIQYTAEPTGDSPYMDQEVTTGGIVYGLVGDYAFFIQDADGAWNGLYVYGTNAGLLVGDEIEVTGTVAEYYNLTELNIVDASSYAVLSSGNPLYAATIGTIATIFVEDYEGVFVGVETVTCTIPDMGYGEWEISDGADLAVVDDMMFAYLPVLDECFNLVQGALNFGYGAFKLEPREAGDIVNCAGLDAPVVTITYAGGNALLSWDPIVDATDYRVHVSSEPFSGWDAGILTGGATTYSLATTGRVFFHVIALN
jgi:hypothetical protein